MVLGSNNSKKHGNPLEFERLNTQSLISFPALFAMELMFTSQSWRKPLQRCKWINKTLEARAKIAKIRLHVLKFEPQRRSFLRMRDNLVPGVLHLTADFGTFPTQDGAKVP
jgi:hypothetical protein